MAPERGRQEPLLNDRYSAGHASALHSITLEGDTDSDRQAQLLQLEENYRQANAVDVVLDLHHVSNLDQRGLESLAFLYRDATERGGTVTVVRAPGPVVRAIRRSGLDRPFRPGSPMASCGRAHQHDLDAARLRHGRP